MSRKVLAQHLNALGFSRIAAVASAIEAQARMIDSFERGEPFQLVFLDWHMPGQSGDRFLVQCRQDERFSAVPIIMATAENEPKNILSALKNGATSYIVKPISHADLRKRIGQVLRVLPPVPPPNAFRG